MASPVCGAAIGLGEWRVSADPDEVLASYGLGSCVAVVLCDPDRLAALVHVVLPDSRGDPRGMPGKFADTAVPFLVDAICRAGGRRERLRAFICGGASMFTSAGFHDVGRANVEAVRRGLASLRIPVCGEDVGGNKGRTVHVEVGTARVQVTSAGRDRSEFAAR